MTVTTAEEVEQYNNLLAQINENDRDSDLTHTEKTGDWYIWEYNAIENATAFYGPFTLQQAYACVNDNYGNALCALGADLEITMLSDLELKNAHINSREFWMSQLKSLS